MESELGCETFILRNMIPYFVMCISDDSNLCGKTQELVHIKQRIVKIYILG